MVACEITEILEEPQWQDDKGTELQEEEILEKIIVDNNVFLLSAVRISTHYCPSIVQLLLKQFQFTTHHKNSVYHH